MTSRSHLRAAVAAFVAALVFGACGWYFAWRQGAYWSTGERITPEQSRRAGALCTVFGCSAAVAAVSGLCSPRLVFGGAQLNEATAERICSGKGAVARWFQIGGPGRALPEQMRSEYRWRRQLSKSGTG
jgi:hypothetical protein